MLTLYKKITVHFFLKYCYIRHVKKLLAIISILLFSSALLAEFRMERVICTTKKTSNCGAYIYIFPLVYTPTIINKVGLDTHAAITYFIVLLSEFMLISLYNIQDQLEYPFDKDGLDDIKIEKFKLDR